MLKNTLLFLIALSTLQFSCEDECDYPECSISLTGTPIVVSANVSGGSGTHITPDVIDSTSITTESATVTFKVKRIGKCHVVLGHGHVWSSSNSVPTLGNDNYSDYENNVNFNDEISTVIRDLTPNTRYWVRSWIAIEIQDCSRQRVVFYNDKSTEFTTL